MTTDRQVTESKFCGGKPERLRVAFLGGAINSAVGRVHRVAIELDQRFKLVAGCFSRHLDVNHATANDYGVPLVRTYQTLTELMAHEASQLDAIVILTPTNQHKDQVLMCLKAGVPIICEKSLVCSSSDARTIKEAIGSDGFLAVTYNYTGYPMLRELKHLVQQGFFGKIDQIHIEMPQEGFSRISLDGAPIVPQPWRLHDQHIPTVSLDLGVHLHSIINFLTSESPVAVSAMSNTFGNFSQVVDNVLCLAKYTNDMVCSIWYGKTSLGYRNGLKVRLFGKAASAEWYQENPEKLRISDRNGRIFTFDRASPDINIANLPRYTRFKAGHPSGFIEAFANYYSDVADSIGDFIRHGRQIPSSYVFCIDEALEGLKLLEAISESSSENKWCNV